MDFSCELWCLHLLCKDNAAVKSSFFLLKKLFQEVLKGFLIYVGYIYSLACRAEPVRVSLSGSMYETVWKVQCTPVKTL